MYATINVFVMKNCGLLVHERWKNTCPLLQCLFTVFLYCLLSSCSYSIRMQ